MNDETDRLLASLLAPAERAPDDAFTARMEHLVRADRRLRAVRRVAWTRFAMEMAASAALLVAFALLARIGPLGDSGRTIPLYGPAAASLLLLTLWVAISLRPENADVRH